MSYLCSHFSPSILYLLVSFKHSHFSHLNFYFSWEPRFRLKESLSQYIQFVIHQSAQEHQLCVWFNFSFSALFFKWATLSKYHLPSFRLFWLPLLTAIGRLSLYASQLRDSYVLLTSFSKAFLKMVSKPTLHNLFKCLRHPLSLKCDRYL